MDEREHNDGAEHIDTTRARGGTTPRMTRVILPVSIGLIVVIFALLLLFWG